MSGDEGMAPGEGDGAAEEAGQQKRMNIHQTMINDLLRKEQTSHDWRTDTDDVRQLKFSKLSFNAKKAHYKTPDYCFITTAESLNILLLEIDPLVEQGGILYGLYNEIKTGEDFEKKAAGKDLVRVVIYFDDPKIDLMGEKLKVETRMKFYDCQLPFKNYASKLFCQFNSRQQQHIVTETLQKEIDFEYLMESGVIVDHFAVHMPERRQIYAGWLDYRYRLVLGMLTGNFLDNMQPLNVIKDYYGEKMAFYFAWLIHYTGWLIPPMIIGFIFGCVMIGQGYQNEEAPEEYLNRPLSFVYGVIMMIWITLFNESWIRKQNQIANEWLVRNYQDATTECDDFQCETAVDPDTAHKWKVAKKSAYKTQMSVGLPVSIVFVILVILSQVLLQWMN